MQCRLGVPGLELALVVLTHGRSVADGKTQHQACPPVIKITSEVALGHVPQVLAEASKAGGPLKAKTRKELILREFGIQLAGFNVLARLQDFRSPFDSNVEGFLEADQHHGLDQLVARDQPQVLPKLLLGGVQKPSELVLLVPDRLFSDQHLFHTGSNSRFGLEDVHD